MLVATARELETLKEAGVQLDVLVRSAKDEAERYEPGDLEPPLLGSSSSTEGKDGGSYESEEG